MREGDRERGREGEREIQTERERECVRERERKRVEKFFLWRTFNWNLKKGRNGLKLLGKKSFF